MAQLPTVLDVIALLAKIEIAEPTLEPFHTLRLAKASDATSTPPAMTHVTRPTIVLGRPERLKQVSSGASLLVHIAWNQVLCLEKEDLSAVN